MGVAVLRLDDFVGHERALVRDFVVLAPHEALDREYRVLRVRHRLTLRGLTHEAFAGFRERDDRRRGALPFGVGDHDGLAAFHHGHAGVRRPEVDAKNFSHNQVPFAGSRRVPRKYVSQFSTSRAKHENPRFATGCTVWVRHDVASVSLGGGCCVGQVGRGGSA